MISMPSNDFRPIEIRDRETFASFFRVDPPRTSELTFTNLFMWRHKYHPQWRREKDCLLIILRPEGSLPFGLPPIGPEGKGKALDILIQDLKRMTDEPKICRVDENFVNTYVDHERFRSVADRDNADYVYLSQDGCILDDDIVGMMYFAPKTDWFVIKAAKSLDRFSLSIAAASEERKCLAISSVVKSRYRQKLGQSPTMATASPLAGCARWTRGATLPRCWPRPWPAISGSSAVSPRQSGRIRRRATATG